MLTTTRVGTLTVLLLLSLDAPGASLTLTGRPAPGRPLERDWVVTAIDVIPNEIRTGNNGGPATYAANIGFSSNGLGTACYYDINGSITGALSNPLCRGLSGGGRVDCTDRTTMAATFQRFIGATVRLAIPVPNRGITYQMTCLGPPPTYWYVLGIATTIESTTSCTAAAPSLTLRGNVGEKLKATTDLQIHCDQQANLRLSVPNGGVVSVGGEGEVLLTFQTNGSDVLNVSGTDPVVSLDGELTKSPTTAGTYRGSTVLRLDIL